MEASRGSQRYVADLVQHALRVRRPICFDSSVLIELAGAQQPLTSLLVPVLDRVDLTKVVSTITLSEIVTRPARTGDTALVAAIHQALLALPRLFIVDFDQRHAIETAHVRAETGMKLPDAAIIATARLADASALIGNDRQWRNRALGVPYHHMDDILALS